MKTYAVYVEATAFRIVKVRARSAQEAYETVSERVNNAPSGAWRVDFAGSPDQHFSVYENKRDGRWLGPDTEGECDE